MIIKKKIRKRISCLLVFALLLISMTGDGLLGAAHAGATPSYDGVLTLNVPVSIFLTHDIQKGNRTATYQFTPEESGEYTFYSISDQETAGYLCSANGTILDSDYRHSGHKNNFSLSCSLSSGVSYYFTAQFSEASSAEGTFQIVICKKLAASSFEDAVQVTLNPKGNRYEFANVGDTTKLTFTPTATGNYAFYQMPSCDCKEDKHEENCTYIQNLYMTLYENTNDTAGTLQAIDYSTAEATDGGFVIYHHLQEGTTYYLDIHACNEQAVGDFILGISDALSDAPIPDLEMTTETTTINYAIESTLQSIYVHLSTGGTMQFTSSDGNYVFAEILNNDGTSLDQCEESTQYMDYTTSLPPEGGYLRLYTQLNLVQDFHLTVTAKTTPAPTVTPNVNQTAAPSEKPSTTPTETPSTTPMPTTSADPSVTDDPTVTKSPAPSVSGSPGSTPTPKVSPLPMESSEPNTTEPPKQMATSPAQRTNITPTPNTRAPKVTLAKVKWKKCKRKGKKVTFQWKKVKNASGYEITYGYKKNYKKAKVRRTRKLKTIISIKRKKKCYIRIRAYRTINGKRYYGKYTKKTYRYR